MLHRATSDYGNITTFSESPRRQGLLAVGTDDGMVQVTQDDGGSWLATEIPSTVPEKTFVSRVVWSHHAEGTMYATFEGHKDNNFLPYVYKSTDYGATWRNIAGDLPEFGPVRVVVEHPRNPNLLFVGTEFSAFVSITGGEHWIPMKAALPTVPVHDIVIQSQKNDLVIGTHGRGFFILDDITILEELSGEVLASDFHLASIQPAYQLHKFNRGRGSMGHTRYLAPNPPEGAIITFYVKPATMEAAAEDSEESKAPKIEVDILDGTGARVRRLDPPQGSKGTGIQRLVWDLRHPPAWQAGEDETARRLRGPFVLPGIYQVRLKIGGDERVRNVEVKGDPSIDISTEDRLVLHDTLLSLNQMLATSRAVLSTTREVQNRLQDIRQAIEAHGEVPGSIRDSVDEIAGDVDAIFLTMEGEETGTGATLPGAPPLADLVRQLYVAIEAATAIPTTEQRRLTRLSHEKLTEQIAFVNQLTGSKMPALEKQLADSEVPWTPGRPIRERLLRLQ
jgi:hypothetical protein